MSDFPSGDGSPDCPLCRGRGVITLTGKDRPPYAIGEVTQICSCVLVRDVIQNLERGWRGLSKAKPIKGVSPLLDLKTSNVWITSSNYALKQHLRYVAARQGPRWNFLVVSDASLMDAWLAKGLDVYDADILRMREDSRYKVDKSSIEALSELVEHPALLVVCLGVKAARNSAMPEVLMETLTLRDFSNKPTWVVDQPTYPLMDGHISYNQQVGAHMENWEQVILEQKNKATQKKRPPGITQRKQPVSRKPVKNTSTVSLLDGSAELQKMKNHKYKKKWGR